MPKAYDQLVPGTHALCEVCGDSAHYLRSVGPHIGEFCANGHQIGGVGNWLSRDLFAEGGARFGELPPEDFDRRYRRRARRFALLEHFAVTLRSELVCFWCATERFHGPRQASTVRDWLRRWHPAIYGRLLERFKRNDGTDMAVLPTNWPAHIDRTFHREIEQELDFSTIEADHLISVRLLELMEPDAEVTASMLKIAGRELGVPSCQRCNRGRYRAPFDPPERIMELWARYAFDGNVHAAKADPRWNVIEPLAIQAYRIDQNFEELRRRRLG